MKPGRLARRLGACFALAALAGASTTHAASIDIDKISGVYKYGFKNANIAGEKYDSESILEIVKVSPSSAYLRAHLEFFNGHICNIWGVAKADGNSLVYRGETNAQGKTCMLSVGIAGGKITLSDKDGACASMSCGARGMYTGVAFDLNKRRPIRYMDILRKSDEYLDAIDESEGKPKTRLP